MENTKNIKKKTWLQWPFHVFLLPLFFVLSMYVQLAGLLRVMEISKAFVLVLAGMLVLWGLLYLFFKNKINAGVAATVIGVIVLFFGSIKDMLGNIPVVSFISSYKVILFLLPVLLIYFLYRVKKSPSLRTASLFLNVLFLIYLGIEGWKWWQQSKSAHTAATALAWKEAIVKKDSLPDIYYLVLDSYPSSTYQQEVLNSAPNFLDTALAERGFHIIPHPRSNYHLTAFSIASTLNMQYFDWVKPHMQAQPYHYSKASTLVEKSTTIKWLSEHGYQLQNLSVFDMPGVPSINKERFFSTTSEEIIYHNTLWSRIKWQVLPVVWPSYTRTLLRKQEKNVEELVGKFKAYNLQLQDALLKKADAPNSTPKFVYAHFEMPHYPYFYDSTGNAYPPADVFRTSIKDKEKFKNYIAYVNHAATRFVDTILQRNPNTVIILQSDHGTKNLDESRPGDAFTNYSSFYFPDKDYRLFYDSMSNVNSFRIIFNKYFNQRLPLLADSSVYIYY